MKKNTIKTFGAVLAFLAVAPVTVCWAETDKNPSPCPLAQEEGQEQDADKTFREALQNKESQINEILSNLRKAVLENNSEKVLELTKAIETLSRELTPLPKN